MINIRKLVDRNADACERALHPRCRCHCGGALHGAAHSLEWREKTARTIEESHNQRRSCELAELGLFLELRLDSED